MGQRARQRERKKWNKSKCYCTKTKLINEIEQKHVASIRYIWSGVIMIDLTVKLHFYKLVLRPRQF
jgi:hypothetical protein